MQRPHIDGRFRIGRQGLTKDPGSTLTQLVSPLLDLVGMDIEFLRSISVFSPLIAASCCCCAESPLIPAVRISGTTSQRVPAGGKGPHSARYCTEPRPGRRGGDQGLFDGH